MTNKTTAGQMAEHRRFRREARQAKMKAKDGTQARAVGTDGATVKTKAQTGMEMVGRKNGKARKRE